MDSAEKTWGNSPSLATIVKLKNDLPTYPVVIMAVPKKKMSKARSRRRYAGWLRKADAQAAKAMSLGRSILTQRNSSFYYPNAAADEADEES